MVRKGGLEPPHLSVPDPKSGASANSATFALALRLPLQARRRISRVNVLFTEGLLRMSQERGQARLPNPELLYLAYDLVLKGIQSIKATRVGAARGREGGLAPAPTPCALASAADSELSNLQDVLHHVHASIQPNA